MSYDGREVVNFILDYCEAQNRAVTNLSLQKMLYFCHVWSLVTLGLPLVRHKFEAWEHGPVLQYIYREFKFNGNSAITQRATKIDKLTGQKVNADYQFDEGTTELLSRVVGFYSRLTASQLRNMSHIEGGPWDKVWNHTGKVNPGMKIEDEAIRDFYSRVPPPNTIQ